MKTKASIEVFSTSFLDLLSCGMGAAILLCLIFAASKKMRGQVKGGTLLVTLVVTPSDPAPLNPAPLICVWAEVDREYIKPASSGPDRSWARRNTPEVSIHPNEHAANAYQVVFRGTNFGSRDKLIVFLADLNGQHKTRLKDTRVEVQCKVVGRGQPQETGQETRLELTLESPVRQTKSLVGCESASFSLQWEEYTGEAREQ